MFHDSEPLDLLCFLIPLSTKQQGGRREKEKESRVEDDDDDEGIMFLHKCSWGDGEREYFTWRQDLNLIVKPEMHLENDALVKIYACFNTQLQL